MPWNVIGKVPSESSGLSVAGIVVNAPPDQSWAGSSMDIRPYSLWIRMFPEQGYDRPFVIMNSDQHILFEVGADGKPIIESPNGTKYRILVADDGTLSTEIVS